MRGSRRVADIFDRRHQRVLVRVIIQPELVPGRRVERGHANVDAVGPDVKTLGKLLDEVPYLGEVPAGDAA